MKIQSLVLPFSIYKLVIDLDAHVIFTIHNDALFGSRARVPEEIYRIMEFSLVRDLSISLPPGLTKGRHAQLDQRTI
jgi:hypothetical protein